MFVEVFDLVKDNEVYLFIVLIINKVELIYSVYVFLKIYVDEK